jgi:hypothetical protein
VLSTPEIPLSEPVLPPPEILLAELPELPAPEIPLPVDNYETDTSSTDGDTIPSDSPLIIRPPLTPDSGLNTPEFSPVSVESFDVTRDISDWDEENSYDDMDIVENIDFEKYM